jgi:PAS domain S-box-containing protein
MGHSVAVRFVTAPSGATPALDALRRRDDIEVLIAVPEDLQADGGIAAVDCIVIDTDAVTLENPGPPGDETPVIRTARDPPGDADGNWVGVGSVAGRRTLVDRVRESASSLTPAVAKRDQEFVTGVPVPAYVLDVCGRFVAVNDALLDVTGYERRALVGSHATLVVAETSEATVDDGERTLVRLSTEAGGAIECLRDAGVGFVARQTESVMRTVGTVEPRQEHPNLERDGTALKQAVDTAHDPEPLENLTEQTETERELKRQRDALKLLNQVIRHDIRNDLQMILSYAGHVADNTDGQIAESAARIRQTARNATALTRDARNLSEVVLEPDQAVGTVRLDEVVEQEVVAARDVAPDARITIAGDLPRVEVQATDAMASVVRNLLKNAVYHTETTTPRIRVSVSEATESVTVEVADNGPGVPDEMKPDVFGEGMQGIDSDGTGLGLYLVETLVEHVGGSVWVRDNDPKGAVFGFDLPRVE